MNTGRLCYLNFLSRPLNICCKSVTKTLPLHCAYYRSDPFFQPNKHFRKAIIESRNQVHWALGQISPVFVRAFSLVCAVVANIYISSSLSRRQTGAQFFIFCIIIVKVYIIFKLRNHPGDSNNLFFMFILGREIIFIFLIYTIYF